MPVPRRPKEKWGMVAENGRQRCDACGRFIAMRDMVKLGGATVSVQPLTEFTCERVQWRCKTCTEKYGPVTARKIAGI